jgi:hypothetical protein
VLLSSAHSFSKSTKGVDFLVFKVNNVHEEIKLKPTGKRVQPAELARVAIRRISESKSGA